jgi:Predicted sugar nucleotidyltransferases
MTYIILAAGQGTKLQPLTLRYAKTQYKLDTNTTLLQRMVRLIRKYDKYAEIIVVVGYKKENIRKELESENVKFITNPFYAVTGSVVSLWFARDYLERENVTVINGDIVFEEKLFEQHICQNVDKPFVYLDSSKKQADKWYIQTKNEQVLVLSKQLDKYFGEYCHLVKLDAVSSRLLKNEVMCMIDEEIYDQYFEIALVQMIFSHNFALYYMDMHEYYWTEVESVNDLHEAQEIHKGMLTSKKMIAQEKN